MGLACNSRISRSYMAIGCRHVMVVCRFCLWKYDLALCVADVRLLISDIDKIGIEHLVLNDGIIVVRDNQNNGKYGSWNYSFPCPIFDRFFPTYVRVRFS